MAAEKVKRSAEAEDVTPDTKVVGARASQRVVGTEAQKLSL